MGFRLIGFSKTSTDAAYTATTVLADDSINKIDTTHVKVPSQNRVAAAYGYGVHLTGYRIKTPSLSGGNRLPIQVDDVDATASHLINTTPPLKLWDKSVIPLQVGEGLSWDNITDTTSGVVVGLIWLADGATGYVSGQFMPGIRATSSTACVAYTWTNMTLTFDNQLPAGSYAVVGMSARSATCIAARLAFPETGARPGVLGGVTNVAVGRDAFRNGRFLNPSGNQGTFVSWGGFVNDSPPSVDWLAVTTDSAEYVILDLVKFA